MKRLGGSILAAVLAACASLDGLSGGGGPGLADGGVDAGPDRDPTGACAAAHNCGYALLLRRQSPLEAR